MRLTDQEVQNMQAYARSIPLTEAEIQKLVLETAAKSPAQKRKVGAVLVSAAGKALISGYNFNPDQTRCEDSHGDTLAEVVHAEISCLINYQSAVMDNLDTLDIHKQDLTECTMYVSHQPCENCRLELLKSGITRIKVVEAFMKFDGDKLRYDLVPPSAVEGLARVLTFGARKYKPNNWRNVTEPDRYIAAMERHIALYKSGEQFDEDSGIHHLAHAMTNMAFLVDLNYLPAVLGNAQLEKL